MTSEAARSRAVPPRIGDDPGGSDSSFPGAAILDELDWRGLIASSTDLGALRAELAAGPMTLYCGFDPTAASLHVGHLAQCLTLRRFQQLGHRPLALVGGATGMIGDPKPTAERALNSADQVQAWSKLLKDQLEHFLDFDGPNAARMVNNHDWTESMSVISFLRDIGKHFSVNRMLDRDAVARRLADQGISYTEFSYVLLQSMDYLELFRRYDCRLQTGGSDQFGNIVAGVDLVRRVEAASVHALTTPLMVKADGTKFGKTEGGAVWLDPELTSPYAFYQFWLNTDDRDVSAFLRIFSMRGAEELAALDAELSRAPARRAAQYALADELTALVHGEHALTAVRAASQALFGSGDLAAVPAATLTAALRETPFGEVVLDDGQIGVLDVLTASGLVPSKGAARRTILEGGASVNNMRITDDTQTFGVSDCLAGEWLVVRRGRRNISGVRVLRS